MDALAELPFLQGGAVGILALVFLGVVRGWLVPGRTVDRISAQWQDEKTALVSQWEARLKESHEREQSWKAAHDRRVDQADTLSNQVDALVSAWSTMEDFIGRFRDFSRGGGPQ